VSPRPRTSPTISSPSSARKVFLNRAFTDNSSYASLSD
jgi:hypothetical protein